MSLYWYINDSASLLNDQNLQFNSKSQLTRWINEARRMAARRTMNIRRLISGQSAFGASSQPGYMIPGGVQPGALPDGYPQAGNNNGPFSNQNFNSDFANQTSNNGLVPGAITGPCATIPNVERYPFIGFFNNFARAQHAGIRGIVDVGTCNVNWGGTVRPTLLWMPWDDFQAYCRAYASLAAAFPSVWSTKDGENGELWFWPPPSTAGDIELDAYCIPSDLYSDDDYDAIDPAFRDAIKFGACALMFMSSQRYSQAQLMDDLFADRLGVARAAVDRGKTPNYYPSRF